MKVLFAVNDENISTSIVKKYQKEYKEIISYKNVYYFNAILKELQRNKSYDRVVISEDLEEFTSSSYEQKDKFIFDRLDNISDEAISTTGVDIPIILISSERRNAKTFEPKDESNEYGIMIQERFLKKEEDTFKRTKTNMFQFHNIKKNNWNICTICRNCFITYIVQSFKYKFIFLTIT